MSGADEFVAGLRQLRLEPQQRAGLIVVPIEAVSGAHAGQHIEVGVAVEELASWPLVTPHWVHLPAPLTLPDSNRQPSDQDPSWQRYSRPLKGRVDALPSPVRAWVAHIRSLLGALVT